MVRWLCRSGWGAEHQAWDECIPARTVRCTCHSTFPLKGDSNMTWQTPAATDLRFGFEITMYVSAR
jgi:coenzyme PQQ precursor peptide PqqA